MYIDPIEDKYKTVEARNAAIIEKAENGNSLEDLAAEFDMRPEYIREIAGDYPQFPPREFSVVFLEDGRFEAVTRFDDILSLPEKDRKHLARFLRRIAYDLSR